jgi:hypothetical protein
VISPFLISFTILISPSSSLITLLCELALRQTPVSGLWIAICPCWRLRHKHWIIYGVLLIAHFLTFCSQFRTIISEILFQMLFIVHFHIDRLRGLVIRVPCYRSRGPRFDSRRYHIFWEVVGLERGPLSPARTLVLILACYSLHLFSDSLEMNLWRYATSRKVPCSRPRWGDFLFFIYLVPPVDWAMRFTQSLTGMSTRSGNIMFLESRARLNRADNLTAICEPIV